MAVVKQLTAHKNAASAVAILLAATILAGVLNFATQVVLARVLGAGLFGSFASALAMVTLVAPLAGFGLAGYWLKVYGQEGWMAQRWLPASIRFLSLSTALVVTVVYVWAWFGPHDLYIAKLVTILSFVIFGQVSIELVSAKYLLEGRHAALAVWQFLNHFLRFSGIAALIYLVGTQELTAIHVAGVFAVVAVALTAPAVIQLKNLAGAKFTLEGHAANSEGNTSLSGLKPPSIGAVMHGAWPFGLAGIFYLIYFQSDIILVKYMVGDESAGIYNVAFVIIASVYLFPAVIYQKFLLPRLHRWAYRDLAKFSRVFRLGNFVMLTLGLASMLLLWWLAPIALPWLFGDTYRDAVPLVMVLAVAAPFRFLASSAGAMLVTRDYMRVKIRLMAAAATINIILNLVLIPQLGAMGAAIATVLTEAFTAFTYLVLVKGYLKELPCE